MKIGFAYGGGRGLCAHPAKVLVRIGALITSMINHVDYTVYPNYEPLREAINFNILK